MVCVCGLAGTTTDQFAQRQSCYVVMLIACWSYERLFVLINELKITVNQHEADPLCHIITVLKGGQDRTKVRVKSNATQETSVVSPGRIYPC